MKGTIQIPQHQISEPLSPTDKKIKKPEKTSKNTPVPTIQNTKIMKASPVTETKCKNYERKKNSKDSEDFLDGQ